jgi:hypothetical protein
MKVGGIIFKMTCYTQPFKSDNIHHNKQHPIKYVFNRNGMNACGQVFLVIV